MTRPHNSFRWAVLPLSLRIVLVAGLAFGAFACGGGSGGAGDDPSRVGDGGSADDDGAILPWEQDATYELDADDIDIVRDADAIADGAEPGVCGNGKFEEKELCDDGNTRDGDGCSADCSNVDPDYLCVNAGEDCVRFVVCGNGVIEGSEVCDDGAQTPKGGDGCSADCKLVEPGFSCAKPGQACVTSPVCGNGQRERGEQCDDGEASPDSGDGCDASCQLENPTAWFCPPGSACVALVCGDGVRTPNEQCDDGDNPPQGGDGCDINCRLEPGFRCGSSGCGAICGDGRLAAGEECDDSDLVSGDGCSASCKKEPFFTCPSAAGDCTSSIVCGDGCVDPGEICDPGNLSNRCGQADASCISTSENPAQACNSFEIASDPGVCGDGTVNLNEQCDPACTGARPCNIPGCNGCQITSGWACPRAGYCFQIPRCGDSVIQIGEECDPGPSSIAGCNATTCQIVSGYYCSGTPSLCVRSLCGDGVRAPNEQCDDGPGTVNAPGTPVGSDGCSATCTVETGYVCPPNLSCKPICGNGVLQPGEECEEVSAGCGNCFIRPGYACNLSGTSCALTVCGADNTGVPATQRGEGCDDGNDIAGDGCSPTCQLEPTFTHDTSGTPTNTAQTCGDGFKTLSEGCDDGNRTNGDGCSSACAEESGWICTENSITYPGTIDFRVTYRDFKARGETGGHPHFKHTDEFAGSGADYGITGQLCSTTNYNATPVANTCGLLDSAGKPRHVKAFSNTIVDNSAAFGLWYRNSNSTNITGAGSAGVIQMHTNPGTTAAPGTPPTTPDVLRLSRVGSTSAYTLNDGAFWDLDGRGFGNTPGQTHNFNFTTELRYFFQYRGGEELIFEGDDDVWVFVNGRLAVDVGGIHCPHVGRVVLGDENGSCNLQLADAAGCTAAAFSACTTYTSGTGGEQSDTNDGRFNITKGEVYEVVLFHAERNPTGSNFRLTLDGFLAPRSTCTTDCGDGIRAGNEICDTNSGLASGYNVCLGNCTINFCGDGTTQGPSETCDSVTKVTYRQTAGGCGFDCRPAPYCGDGQIQAFAGEVCDDGVNSGAYGSCTTNCKGFGGYCGDGTRNGTEQCDSASKVAYQANGMGCGFDCKWAPSCGDGTRNGPETCEPPNSAQCSSTCQVQPFCGDGIQSPTEACDYGKFNAAPASVEYGGCTTGCVPGPRCGDMVRQEAAGEECDSGGGNSPAESPAYNSCTTTCLNGPRCGDGIRQPAQEACDNGFNEDTYAHGTDACGPGCTAVPFCGDGMVNSAVEQCDNGMSNSDGAYNGCRSDCFWGPYCGDGSKNGSEECDDPNGNVPYSVNGTGCSFECKLNVPSCGDGVRNGPEQCDDGKANNSGAYGGCNSNCTRAPHCGDRVVQEGTEVCDDGPTGSFECTQSCTSRVILL